MKILKDLDGNQKDVMELAWSPNMEYLAASSFDSHALVYEVSSGKVIHQTKRVGMADGFYLKDNGDVLIPGTVSMPNYKDDYHIVLDLPSGKEYKNEIPFSVNKVTFSSDGKLFTAGGYNGELAVVETQSGKVLMRLGE